MVWDVTCHSYICCLDSSGVTGGTEIRVCWCSFFPGGCSLRWLGCLRSAIKISILFFVLHIFCTENQITWVAAAGLIVSLSSLSSILAAAPRGFNLTVCTFPRILFYKEKDYCHIQCNHSKYCRPDSRLPCTFRSHLEQPKRTMKHDDTRMPAILLHLQRDK